MKKALPILFIAIAVVAKSDFLDCVFENCAPIAPTQSTSGEYVWYKDGDSLSGSYFYLPPRGIFITIKDTVEFIELDSLHDPWFEWWIWRNPARNREFYKITSVRDSGLFKVYEYIPIDKNYPSVRIGYYKLSCLPGFALFYYPAELKHGFPGADEIFYEFTMTEAWTLAPKKRIFFNKYREPVDVLSLKTVRSVKWTPPDDEIIQLLMEEFKEGKKD